MLSRPELRRKFSSLNDALILNLLDAARRQAVWIPVGPALFSLPRDPKDEPYINLAIKGRADFLVTRDRDLLDLDARDSTYGDRLRQLAPDLRIQRPEDFLQHVRKTFIH